MKIEGRKKDLKDGKKFGRDSINHFTDLCSATEKSFGSPSEDSFTLKENRL